jgi:site-specific DNA recombinase
VWGTQVQQVLDAHRLSGDRAKKHQHYLKGSIFCAHCGLRLLYGRHRGKGGVYEYFSCISHQGGRQSCGAHYVPVEAVETGIEGYYRRIELRPAQAKSVRRRIKAEAEAKLGIVRKQSERHSRRLRTLQDEQQKLLHLYYRGGVSEEVLQAEQQRIEAERTQARRLIEGASLEAEDILEALDDALVIVSDCHKTYLAGDATLRRMMNQAIFSRFLVRLDEIDGERETVFEYITRLAEDDQSRGPENDQGPVSGALGSDVIQMVPRAGLEPAPPD